MLHLLLSTLLAINAGLLYHLQESQFWIRELAIHRNKDMKLIVHGNGDGQHILDEANSSTDKWIYDSLENGVIAACAGKDIETAIEAHSLTSALADEYLHWRTTKVDAIVAHRGVEVAPNKLDVIFAVLQYEAQTPEWRWLPSEKHYSEKVSCVLRDFTLGVAWLVSDNSGAFPLWYALLENVNRETHLISTAMHVTTDLMASQRMLQEENQKASFAPLGGGQVMALDIDSGAVLSSYSGPRAQALPQRTYMSVSARSRQLLNSVMKELGSLKTDQRLLLEADQTSSSALLLECATGMSRRRTNSLTLSRSAPPHITDLFVPRRSHSRWALFSGLLANLTTYTTNDLNFPTGGSGGTTYKTFPGTVYPASEHNEPQAWSEPLVSGPWGAPILRVAASRFDLCVTAADSGAILVSHHSGVFSTADEAGSTFLLTALKAYYTNIFCTRLGVRVVHPLTSVSFQDFVHSSGQEDMVREGKLKRGRPGARLYLAVQRLQQDGLCANTPVEHGKIVLTFPVNGQNSTDILTRQSAAGIAPVTTRLQIDNNSKAAQYGELHKVVKAHAEAEDGRLFVLLATRGYEPTLRNFLCSASRVLRSSHQADKHNTCGNSFKQSASGSGTVDCRDLNEFTRHQSFSVPTDNPCPVKPPVKLPLLVITFDASVAATAQAAGAGAFVASAKDLNCIEYNDVHLNNGSDFACDEFSESAEASFGSKAYQRLMLFRTNIVWEILAMNYSPIIADIDTVWLQNPLPILRQVENAWTTDAGDVETADVTVAMDRSEHGSEVCGCFVALHARPGGAALVFWTEVKSRHAAVVRRWGQSTFKVESEQKILTDLLKKRTGPISGLPGKVFVDNNDRLRLAGFRTFAEASTEFSRITGMPLRVAVLPEPLFPSGFAYFQGLDMHSYNFGSKCGQTPAIIHNNFLIGQSAKVARFRRHGFWYYRNWSHAALKRNVGSVDQKLQLDKDTWDDSIWQDGHCVYKQHAHEGVGDALYDAPPTISVHEPRHQSFIDAVKVNPSDQQNSDVNVPQVNEKEVQVTSLVTIEGTQNQYSSCYSADRSINSSIAQELISANESILQLHFETLKWSTEMHLGAFHMASIVFPVLANSSTSQCNVSDASRFTSTRLSVLMSYKPDNIPSHISSTDVYWRNSNASSSCGIYANITAAQDMRVWGLRTEHARRWNSDWQRIDTDLHTLNYSVNATNNETSVDENKLNTVRAAIETGHVAWPRSSKKKGATPVAFKIKVLSYNHPNSLNRLFGSLLLADYGAALDRGHSVDVEIIMDGARSSENRRPRKKRSIATNARATEHDIVLNIEEAERTKGDLFETEINMDAERIELAAAEERDLARTRVAATLFKWPYGSVSRREQPTHIGRANMWLNAWTPPVAELNKTREVAIVLEDSIEVSPLYFQWLYDAVRLYYDTPTEEGSVHMHSHPRLTQFALQRRLLEAVNADIHADLHRRDNISTNANLQRFMLDHAAASYPLIQGICLQGWIVKKLPRVRNGHMPYLLEAFSGGAAVMFPNAWMAFRQWLSHVQRFDNSFDTFVQNAQENHPKNADVWEHINKRNILNSEDTIARWLDQFISQTQSSFLYPNIPGNFSLAITHRKVEDLASSSVGSTLLLRRHFDGSTEDLSRREIDYYQKYSGYIIPERLVQYAGALTARAASLHALHSLYSAYTYLPPPDRLSEWQYNSQASRVGTIGADTNHFFRFLSNDLQHSRISDDIGIINILHRQCQDQKQLASNPLCMMIQTLQASVRLADQSAAMLPGPLMLATHELYDAFTLDHWVAVQDLIEAYVLPRCTVVHVGMSHSPLLFMLLARFWYHDLYMLPVEAVHNRSHNDSLSMQAQCTFIRDIIQKWEETEDEAEQRITCREATGIPGSRGLAIITQLHASQYVKNHAAESSVSLWSELPIVDHLLVLGQCFGAPSVLFLDQKASLKESNDVYPSLDVNDTAHFRLVRRFTAVGDVCREGIDSDVGAVLYEAREWEFHKRNLKADEIASAMHSHGTVQKEWSISRRQRGGLVTRRALNAFNL